jgi:hypothetical protein
MAEEQVTETVETPDSTTSDELYPAGLAALQAEREARKTLEKQTRQLQQQLRDLQAKVSPEALEQQQKFEQMQAEYEQKLAAERRALQAAHEKQVAELQALNQQQAQALTSATVGSGFQAAYIAAGGRNEPGYSEALQKLVGDRLALVDGILTVMENGSPVLGEDGKPADPAVWMAGLRNDPLYGHFFAPANQGFGGGTPPQIPGLTGATGAQSLSAIDLLKMGLG